MSCKKINLININKKVKEVNKQKTRGCLFNEKCSLLNVLFSKLNSYLTKNFFSKDIIVSLILTSLSTNN